MDVRPRVPGSEMRVAGTDLFVRQVGSGAPALFVHGLGGNSSNWTDLMWLLSDDVHPVSAAAGLPPPVCTARRGRRISWLSS